MTKTKCVLATEITVDKELLLRCMVITEEMSCLLTYGHNHDDLHIVLDTLLLHCYLVGGGAENARLENVGTIFDGFPIVSKVGSGGLC